MGARLHFNYGAIQAKVQAEIRQTTAFEHRLSRNAASTPERNDYARNRVLKAGEISLGNVGNLASWIPLPGEKLTLGTQERPRK
jgi:hypothetical protein